MQRRYGKPAAFRVSPHSPALSNRYAPVGNIRNALCVNSPPGSSCVGGNSERGKHTLRLGRKSKAGDMKKTTAGQGLSLSAKQARFVEEYLTDLNATQAAIRAGYSERSAASVGYENLTKPHISAAISAAQVARSFRTGITQDRILAELAKIGFSDLRKTLTPGGHLLNPGDWDDDTAGAIASLEVVMTAGSEMDDEGRRIPEHVHKIKTWDKLAALDKLGKHLGMFGGEGANLTINLPFDGWAIGRLQPDQD